MEQFRTYTPATRKYYLLLLAAQIDLLGTERRELNFSDDIRSMDEKRDELKTYSLRKPGTCLVGSSLKLLDDVRGIEAAALQFNRDHLAPRALLPEKQVIAAFSIMGDTQGFAVEIDNGFPVCRRSDGDRTTILVASMDSAGIGDRVGDGIDAAVHFYLLSCIRLWMNALSLYSASLTAS